MVVGSVTALGRNGVADWLVQRLTAVVLGVYTLWFVGVLLCTPDMDYAAWRGLFAPLWVKGFSLLALLSVVAHAWVGLWTVSTDYFRPTWLRLVFQLTCALVLGYYLLWGIQILRSA